MLVTLTKHFWDRFFFLVDADWHAFCQAIYKGIEGQEWEALYYHYKELLQAAGAKKPSESRNAKALWTMKAARW